MTASFDDIGLDGTAGDALSARVKVALTPQKGTVNSRQEETSQGPLATVDLVERMSGISAQRPLATGIDTAVQALKRAQDRFGVASEDIARQAGQSEALSTKEGSKPRLPAQTPPNPGPPGGAVPGDLAQAMVQQQTSPRTGDALLRATVEQKTAKHETTADVKTVQAFDAMLEELSRMKATEKPE